MRTQAGVPCLDRCRCLDCKNTAENVASGFANISKGGSISVSGGGGGTPPLGLSFVGGPGSFSAESLKQQMLSHGGALGGKAFLASCFPAAENVPDDK